MVGIEIRWPPPPRGPEYEEGRLYFDEIKDLEEQKVREIRRRATSRHLQPSSTLPPTWKTDFRDDIFLSGRDLEGEDKAWLDAFLDHEETPTAFQKLLDEGARWSGNLFLHIFIVCKPTSFRARSLPSLLGDGDKARENKKLAIILAKYLIKTDEASSGVGEMFGTMTETIVRNLAIKGITIDGNLLPTILETIGYSFENHIRRNYRGPKFDHRSYWVVVSLASLFRRRFNGRPLVSIVASLASAALQYRDAVAAEAKEAGLEGILPGPASSKNLRGSISTQKSKK